MKSNKLITCDNVRTDNVKFSRMHFRFCLTLGYFCIYFYQPVADLLITYAAIYWHCQSAALSDTPTSVMMGSYKLFVVCVLLCSAHSYNISGRIQHFNGAESDVKVSNYISGENWSNTMEITLDRLVDAETGPTLTVAHFKFIYTLNITNIALENVPVFVKTRCVHVHITGNKIKYVPANAFSGPRPSLLELSYNEIQSMADKSVNSGANEVYLRCNNLSHFSQSWFENPGNIQVLALGGNRIDYIQDRAFNQMTKLYLLELGYNQITSIGREAISSGITYLGLQFNEVAQLTPDMFAHRDEPMESLMLYHNQLSYLPEALLLKLKPSEISLVGNPWQCQCLRDIERRLRKLNSTRWDIPSRRSDPVCLVPLSFQNLCVPTVDKELQETYARGLAPVPECWSAGCKSCNGTKDVLLAKLT